MPVRRRTAALTRTTSCRRCRKCCKEPCICPCTRCPAGECECSCRRCGATCVCIQPVEINSDLCVFKRRKAPEDRLVTSVEAVMRMGVLGYEKEPRLFYRIGLARAS